MHVRARPSSEHNGSVCVCGTTAVLETHFALLASSDELEIEKCVYPIFQGIKQFSRQNNNRGRRGTSGDRETWRFFFVISFFQTSQQRDKGVTKSKTKRMKERKNVVRSGKSEKRGKRDRNHGRVGLVFPSSPLSRLPPSSSQSSSGVKVGSRVFDALSVLLCLRVWVLLLERVKVRESAFAHVTFCFRRRQAW